jgi:DNA-binding IscR family transcriptional regulator
MTGTSKITGREVERALKALTGCYLHKSGQGSTWYRCTCKDVAVFCGITKPTARKYLNMLVESGLVGSMPDKWHGWHGMTYVWYGNMLENPVPNSYSEGL